MSTLELSAPDEQEMLERLEAMLLDEATPSDAGLGWLHASLDRTFGPVEPVAARAPVVPLRRRFTAIVSGVAAACVVVALGLAWHGWAERSPSAPHSTTLDAATAALRGDLRNHGPSARIAHGVSSVANALAALPVSERSSASAQSARVIATACRTLEAELPSESGTKILPTLCRPFGAPSALAPSGTPGDGYPGTYVPGGFTPFRRIETLSPSPLSGSDLGQPTSPGGPAPAVGDAPPRTSPYGTTPSATGSGPPASGSGSSAGLDGAPSDTNEPTRTATTGSASSESHTLPSAGPGNSPVPSGSWQR